MFLMDLNAFKDVNDTLGHPVGDKILIAVARRLGSALESEDMLARFGGDEFAIVHGHRDGAADSDTFAARLGELLVAPVEVDGVAITVRGSIGIAHAPEDGADADTLLRHADSAMYKPSSAEEVPATVLHPGTMKVRFAGCNSPVSSLQLSNHPKSRCIINPHSISAAADVACSKHWSGGVTRITD